MPSPLLAFSTLQPVTKFELARSSGTVDVDGHAVRIKVGPFGAKPEFDDAAAAAAALDRPVRDVAAQALREWTGP